ncbi:peptidylprolyl isomerase [Poseidonibacter parvus]|uniref:Peptidylprolyl isomerase n=1 Tax=Poseidonibacter parvus TaxID=1850254 RepID=A0A1P8KII8_9BACT|nr:peptidylprolyl isomerase [Poseidonibacter parvus]APW64363.1 peptidylprolyl isomerase [Poseidonibacter parvus]
MYKLIIAFLLSSTLGFAGVVNAIALTVNDDPITLYDIDKTMLTKKVDKNQAVSLLVDKILYDQLIQKYNIQADIFDVNAYIEKLAASNNMDLFAFKSIVRQKYPDYSVFEDEAKTIVTRQKLIKKLVQGNLKIASEEDIKLYYENNQNKYTTAKTVEVVQYLSNKKASLIATVKSPLLVPNDVQRNPLVLEVKQLDPQMQYLLNNTAQNSFTPIFTANKMYNTLFIIKKEGTDTLDFEVVKNKVFNEVMSLREKKYLKDFFEKQKLTADIKILR